MTMPVAPAPPDLSTEVSADETEPAPVARSSRPKRVRRWVSGALRAGVGVASFGGLAAAVAAAPGGPLLALGWILEAEGRAANGALPRASAETGDAGRRPPLGRLLRASAMLAGAAAVIGVAVQPVRFAAGLAADAAVIAPGSAAARGWRAATLALALAVAAHLTLWLFAGGRTGWFRPLRNLRRVLRDPGGAADRLGAKCGRLWAELAPLSAIWLGLRGLLVAAAWVVPPTALLIAQGDGAGRAALRVIGAVWLAAILPLVPAAQANLTVARHAGTWSSLKAGLNPLAAWRIWRTRPARWVGVLAAVVVGSLPLYSLAVVEVPADARWLLTPVCIAGVLPSRLLAGWTRRGIARSAPGLNGAGPNDARPRWWWTCGWLAVGWGVGLLYAGMLFLTQFTSAAGPAAALHQPGLFTPVPF